MYNYVHVPLLVLDDVSAVVVTVDGVVVLDVEVIAFLQKATWKVMMNNSQLSCVL